ncbi:hypothetical protein [Pseudoxanthomonas mexicana]|uniref:hypothetical protein n=1 Tax=Pseudoxanthomonas mexicana TaxID=128785 RepID=UPI0007864AC2|nr:hypothetical protein [Pseudoxanthomonas mexicana]
MSRTGAGTEERPAGQSSIDPAQVAARLGLALPELAAALECQEERQPEIWRTSALQRKLADVEHISAVVLEMKRASHDALLLMGRAPVRVFNGRTILQVIGAGETDKVLRYLQSIASGQNG